jgi:large subunit ribosomal protein L27
MAHTKTGGKARQHHQRPGKRLGVKKFGGQEVKPGMIIVRQRGTKFHPNEGTRIGRDFTLYAIKEGTVKFLTKMGKKLVSVV